MLDKNITLDSALKNLKTNSIVTLDLSRKNIGDDGASKIAEALSQNTSLLCLNLYKNHISDIGIAKLAEALKVNTTLVELDIGLNGVQCEGAKALAESIKLNTHLKSLKMYRSQLKKGFIDLANALESNTSLIELDLRPGMANGEEQRDALKKIKEKIALNCAQKNAGMLQNILPVTVLEKAKDTLPQTDSELPNAFHASPLATPKQVLDSTPSSTELQVGENVAFKFT